jgi:hypothetical protein
MKRTVGAMMLLAAVGGLGGCVSGDAGVSANLIPGGDGPTGPGMYMNSYRNKGAGLDGEAHTGAHQIATVPNLMGPNGEPIPRSAPFATATSAGEAAARAEFLSHVSPEVIAQTDLLKKGKIGGEIMQAGYRIPADGSSSPPGMPSPLMPASLQGPIPGGLPPGPPNPYGPKPPGAVAAVGALTGGGGPFTVQRTSVRFIEPAGMRITWFAPQPDGKAGFGPNYLEAPARYNFAQACIYRLKLSDIPNRPGLELYPTLEVVPTNARTATFLAHSAVPLAFTADDFAQAAAGNFVVKVVYLPDPQYQDLASTGPDTVVSSQLDPGVDPIAEAHRRGSILLVVRMGNIDLEAPNTPAMDAPSPYMQKPQMPGHGMPPGGMGPQGMMLPGLGGPGTGPMVPYGAMANQGMLPPNMMPPNMPPQAPTAAPTLPTNLQPIPPVPPIGAPGPMGQAPDASGVKQAKFTPAKDAPAKSFSLWPFGKKATDNQ